MKMIFRIARTELKNLFYSPVAWFLTLVFMIVCGAYYAILVEKIALFQDVVTRSNPKRVDGELSYTKLIFLSPGGIFSNIMEHLYLFIPLLTMGVISREVNNGTVKLLYSSPVTVRQIVFGKYLALMIYNLLLLAIVGVFMITGVLNITSADWGLLLSAMVGFYLMICTYTAIGMFMSSLSSYQIVSAIATFVLLFVLARIGSLWQEYDFVRDLTYFLSLKGRTVKMLEGLITSRDVMYFILITSLFLVFTMLKLRSGRKLIPWYKNLTRYTGALLVVVSIGYFTSRPGYIAYFDLTANQDNTIHPKTQAILTSMKDEGVEVTLYTNLMGGGYRNTSPEARNNYIWNFWERYIRFKPDLKFNYVMYYDVNDGDSNVFKRNPGKSLKEIASEAARMNGADFSRFLEPEKIRKMIDLAPENKRAVMQLKYKGRSVFLRTFNDTKFWPDEDHVAAAFKILMEGKGRKVYHSTGNLERDINKSGEREYQAHTVYKDNRGSLINHGYTFDTVNLSLQDIPADASLLVVADPKVELGDAVLTRLHNYIDAGGNMLLVGEPGKQHVTNPVVRATGAQLMPGTLVEVTSQEMPDMVMPYLTREYSYLMKGLEKAMDRLRTRLDNGDTARMLFPGASAVSYADSGFTRKQITVTRGRNAWVKMGKLVTDSAAPLFVPAEGDYKQDSFNLVLPLSRKLGNKEQRVLIAGDADFLNNLRNRSGMISKFYYGWLNDEAYPIFIIPEIPLDVSLKIGHKTALAQKYIYVYILPAAFLLFGIIILIRRKRQ